MKTITRICRVNVLTLLTLIFLLHSVVVKGQSFRYEAKKHYRGFVGSFGSRSFSSQSNFQQVDRDAINVMGGNVGVVFGTDVLRYELGLLGYYTSVSNIAGTIDFYTHNVSVRFYPLNLLGSKPSRIEPYLMGGLAYDQFKFYGHYAAGDPGRINYSGEEPYIGSIKQITAAVGTGIDIKLFDHSDFVHLFTEVKFGCDLSTSVPRQELSNTMLDNHLMVNIGISFGAHR